MKKQIVLAVTTCSMMVSALAQGNKELKMNLNEDGSQFLKATFTGQVWLRHTDDNPGSKVNGYAESQTFDIGLRRVRAQFFGKISDKIFLYTQIGINNDGYNSARKPGIFFHDVLGEYAITKRSLAVGAGLTAWTGFMRYSSPAVASILSYDAPLYQQSTNDVNDQFLRKLSVYAKGKIGKLDYRLILTKPMMVDSTITTVKKISVNSDFSYEPPKVQTSGYFMWQFLDEESNMIPYMTGTYLGKKHVFNVGAGFQYQPAAMWHWSDTTTKSIVHEDMLNYGVDLFYDNPIGSKGSALTVYAAASHGGYGKNYIRNNGAMNPAAGGTSFNGGGSAFPMYGTGQTYFVQAGFLLPKNILGDNHGQLQPYADFTLAQYQRLKQDMTLWDAGVNWLIEGHRTKVSLNYQSRPVFSTTDLKVTEHKGMFVMQLQLAI